ncbi:MAG: hypothetical protein ACERKO_03875 [Acetanaerobacterium sp.]
MNAAISAIVLLPVGLVLLAGVIVLQVFLSKKENRWLGLILPIITFAFSLIVALGNTAYVNDIGQTLMVVLVAFLLFNIPTAILVVIYLACRPKPQKNKELDRMNIQDLG